MSAHLAHLRRAATIAAAGLIFGAATVVGGNGVGGVFNLGVTNSVNETTTLSGAVDGSQLRIVNIDTGPSAMGLAIKVADGRPPIRVNDTAGKAPNLDADKLDGVDSTELQRRVSGGCAAGYAIRSVGADGSVVCEKDDIDGGRADSLRGLTPDFFVRGRNMEADSAVLAKANRGGSAASDLGWVRITYVCPTSGNGTLRLSILLGGSWVSWLDNGNSAPIMGSGDGAGTLSYSASSSGDMFTVQVRSSDRLGTLWIATRHTSTYCEFDANGLFFRDL